MAARGETKLDTALVSRREVGDSLAENWLEKEAMCTPTSDVFEPNRHVYGGFAGLSF